MTGTQSRFGLGGPSVQRYLPQPDKHCLQWPKQCSVPVTLRRCGLERPIMSSETWRRAESLGAGSQMSKSPSSIPVSAHITLSPRKYRTRVIGGTKIDTKISSRKLVNSQTTTTPPTERGRSTWSLGCMRTQMSMSRESSKRTFRNLNAMRIGWERCVAPWCRTHFNVLPPDALTFLGDQMGDMEQSRHHHHLCGVHGIPSDFARSYHGGECGRHSHLRGRRQLGQREWNRAPSSDERRRLLHLCIRWPQQGDCATLQPKAEKRRSELCFPRQTRRI
jgi:hypothetical protein